MNRKILLIENRPGRQKQYLPEGERDVKELDEMKFLDNNGYAQYLEDINNGNFNNLSSFDLLIIHRSALGELSNGSKINEVTKYCKDNGKGLIYFSGGISSSFYDEAGAGFLLINSKDFYSDKLIPFLKNYHEGKISKLIELKYGDSWRLTYLLKLKEYMALNKIEEEDAYIQKIDELKTTIGFETIEEIDQLIKQEVLKL